MSLFLPHRRPLALGMGGGVPSTPVSVLAKAGDSRVSGEILNNGTLTGRNMQNASAWLEFCTHGRVKASPNNNKGVGGAVPSDLLTADGQLDQVIALSPKPSHCWVLTATNAINSATSSTGLVSGLQQNFLNIWQKLRAAGIIPITSVDLPRQWTTTTLTAAAKRAAHAELNSWLLSYAPRYGILVDATSLLVDPGNADGECLTSLYLVESPAIHPGPQGGLLVGETFRDVLTARGLLPARYMGIGALDAYNASTNPTGNLLADGGCFINSGGSTTGGNPPTGTVPSGWILRNDTGSANLTSCVGSLVARTDGGVGNWFRVEATASGACRVLIYGTGTTYNCATGDVLDYAIDLTMVSSSGLSQVSVSLEDRITGGGSVNVAKYGMQHGSVATVGAIPASFDGRVICPPLILGVSFGNLRFANIVEFGSSGGAATFYLGAAELRKVI